MQCDAHDSGHVCVCGTKTFPAHAHEAQREGTKGNVFDGRRVTQIKQNPTIREGSLVKYCSQGPFTFCFPFPDDIRKRIDNTGLYSQWYCVTSLRVCFLSGCVSEKQATTTKSKAITATTTFNLFLPSLGKSQKEDFSTYSCYIYLVDWDGGGLRGDSWEQVGVIVTFLHCRIFLWFLRVYINLIFFLLLFSPSHCNAWQQNNFHSF